MMQRVVAGSLFGFALTAFFDTDENGDGRPKASVMRTDREPPRRKQSRIERQPRARHEHAPEVRP